RRSGWGTAATLGLSGAPGSSPPEMAASSALISSWERISANAITPSGRSLDDQLGQVHVVGPAPCRGEELVDLVQQALLEQRQTVRLLQLRRRRHPQRRADPDRKS